MNNRDENPLRIYEARYKLLEPTDIATRTNVPYDEQAQRFSLRLLDAQLFVGWPDFCFEGGAGILDSAYARLLVLRYLIEGRDAPSTGKFLSYREMPWGAVYDANFQGRCIGRLAGVFGGRIEDFRRACLLLGGTPVSGADAAFELPFLDRHRLRLLLWSRDEEFPPSAQILFSDDFALAFSAEDMAVVGDVSIGRLQELAKQR